MTTYNAGDFSNYGGVRRTCWLDEGAITVSSSRGLGGGTTPTVSGAAEITNGMVVVVSTDTGNTWANTGGDPVVTRIANGNDTIVGIVISEPEEMERKPVDQTAATAANTIALRLTGRHLRSATVWFPNVTAMTQATLNCANAGNVTPGTKEILQLDVSACVAGAGIFVNDVASGGSANIVSMHYAAQAASGTPYILLAFLGGSILGAT
jgi:hypothetical protein